MKHGASYTYNLNLHKMEAGRLGAQGQSQLIVSLRPAYNAYDTYGPVWGRERERTYVCEHIHSLRYTNKMKVILVSKGGGAAREMAVTALSG